jgi:hypothetical protein
MPSSHKSDAILACVYSVHVGILARLSINAYDALNMPMGVAGDAHAVAGCGYGALALALAAEGQPRRFICRAVRAPAARPVHSSSHNHHLHHLVLGLHKR